MADIDRALQRLTLRYGPRRWRPDAAVGRIGRL
jgi:hypothetical protein